MKTKKKTKELSIVQQKKEIDILNNEVDSLKNKLVSANNNPSDQIMTSLISSIESGTLTPDSLTKVLDAQERILDRQAKQSFMFSLSKCQMDIPSVLKNKYNEHTCSYYADVDSLNKAIRPIYTKNGFAVSFGTDTCPTPGMIRVTADLSHSDGHIKNYYFDLPYDLTGIAGTVNKTQIHANGSTMSYGRRYLLNMIFNLDTGEDDDGNSAGAVANKNHVFKSISEEQSLVIHAKLTDNAFDVEIFKKWIKKIFYKDSIDDLPEQHFEKVIKKLDSMIEKSIEKNK